MDNSNSNSRSKNQRSRSRSLYGAGSCLSGQGADLKAFLQEAALEENVGILVEPSSQPSNKTSLFLCRQDAVDEKPSGKLTQSRSDPCNFRINKVQAVQESSKEPSDGHQNIDMTKQMRLKRLELDREQLSNEGNRQKSSFSRGMKDDVFDGLDSSTDNNYYVRSLSDGAATLFGKDISGSLSSSFVITDSCAPSSGISHDDNNFRKLPHAFPIEAIRLQLERSGTINPILIQSLIKKGIEYPLNHFADNKKESMSLSKEGCSTVSDSGSFYEGKIQERLWTSARCVDSVCHKCVEMRQSMKRLKDPNVSIDKLSSDERRLLMNMHIHSTDCDLSRCPFYWCDILPKQLLSPDEIVDVMKQRVENFALDSFIADAKLCKFIMLHTCYPDYMIEDTDWTVLMRLGHSRNTIMALPAKQEHQKSLDYWVIKKVISPPEDDSQKELYQCLLEMKLSGIVEHFWAASFSEPEMFVVCTRFEGTSLQEVIQAKPIQSLNTLVSLMLKLIQILQHLHHNGILFLNWSSSNILIDETQTKVKLADFTASTLKKHVEDDMGWLAGYLPLHLHPPEILQPNKKLDEKSDVWGLGCLLHEMVTGKPVWHQFQHETLHGLCQKMRNQRQPVIPTDVKELCLIFKSCWEFEPSRRPVLDELNQLLIDGQRKQAASTINVYQLSTPQI